MNNEQQQIIDEAYENWCKQFEVDPNNFNVDELVKGHGDQCWGYPILDHVKPTSRDYKRGQINAYLEGNAEKPFFYLSQEEFINKCKTDPEFSERWGLKIEERELSLEARLLLADKINKEIRQDLYTYAFNNPIYTSGIDQRPDDVERHDLLSDLNIPTRLITITYNDKTIESYV
jgi:hypothetical protein